MQALLQWASTHFTFELYMATTKIQGLLWSIADIALVLFFLKIADISARGRTRTKMTIRYRLLWISAVLTPFLFLTKTKNQYFMLDSVICGIQYLILLYTLVFSGRGMIDYFLDILVSARSRPSGTARR